MEVNITNIILSGIAFAVCGTLYLAIDRLVLSPIAHIPGPKLAAVSHWYEFYYDVVLKGRYEWRLVELHDMYGPIIRISPHEVHIVDADFYDTVYPGAQPGRKVNKSEFSMRMFGNYSSMFSTIDHDVHRVKRQTLSNNFSKQAIRRIEPLIYQNVDLMCNQIQQSKDSGSVMNLTYLFGAYAGDVINQATFGSNLGLLTDQAAGQRWHLLWKSLLSMGAVSKQFPILNVIVRSLPEWVMVKIDPGFGLMTELWAMLRTKIEEAKVEKDVEDSKGMFYTLLHDQDILESHKTVQALVDEGQTVVGAGTITTAETLSFVLYQLSNDRKIMSKLQDELRPVMAKSGGRPSLDDLERLPYLNAILKEGLRMTYGATQRLPRIHSVDIVYKDTVIPKGTAISMGAFNIHKNPEYFDKPDDFMPERWLEKGGIRLEKYLVPFSRGTRACLGQNLAWAELYLALANVCAPDRFQYTLFETDQTDIDYVYDWFVGMQRLDSKGVRVLVK